MKPDHKHTEDCAQCAFGQEISALTMKGLEVNGLTVPETSIMLIKAGLELVVISGYKTGRKMPEIVETATDVCANILAMVFTNMGDKFPDED